jgi:hypothetical protein
MAKLAPHPPEISVTSTFVGESVGAVSICDRSSSAVTMSSWLGSPSKRRLAAVVYRGSEAVGQQRRGKLPPSCADTGCSHKLGNWVKVCTRSSDAILES